MHIYPGHSQTQPANCHESCTHPSTCFFPSFLAFARSFRLAQTPPPPPPLPLASPVEERREAEKPEPEAEEEAARRARSTSCLMRR